MQTRETSSILVSDVDGQRRSCRFRPTPLEAKLMLHFLYGQCETGVASTHFGENEQFRRVITKPRIIVTIKCQ